MRDVRELVRRDHLVPPIELADVLAGIGRCRPQVDDRLVEKRPRRSIRDLIWIVDDDVLLLGRSIADHDTHGRVDGLHA